MEIIIAQLTGILTTYLLPTLVKAQVFVKSENRETVFRGLAAFASLASTVILAMLGQPFDETTLSPLVQTTIFSGMALLNFVGSLLMHKLNKTAYSN